MFDRILGNFLVEKGSLSQEQLTQVWEAQEESRVRLGVIAISEQLMTIEQVDEVNKMQAVMDKRFGDIAVEQQYLTEEQVSRLLRLQGNTYLVFIQTILDKGFLTMDEVNLALEEFQKENGLTLTDMDAWKSCDPDRIVPIYFGDEEAKVQALLGTFIRTVVRLVDYHVYLGRPYKVAEYKNDVMSMQMLCGDHNVLAAVAGNEEGVMKAAVAFAGEKFVTEKEDSVDAMCELINCTNGLFATKMYQEQVDVDMLPPEYYMEEVTVKGADLLVVPLYVCGTTIDYVVAFDRDVEIID